MSVSTLGVGARFNPRTVTITPRMALAYAAAIGCEDDSHLDDAAPRELVAPPPLCTALEWLISGDPSSREVLGATPEERARVVHAAQDTQFHRALKAGETVSVGGFIDTVQSTPAGALVTSVMTVTGAQKGDPITSSRVASLYRGVATDGPPVDRSEPAPPAHEAAAWETRQIPIHRGFPHVYTECANIWNPIHTERRAALAAGLPDIIVHGSALWALAWRVIAERHGPVARLSGRFSAMAVPGRPLTLRLGEPASDGGLSYELLTDDGRPAIGRGRAVLA